MEFKEQLTHLPEAKAHCRITPPTSPVLHSKAPPCCGASISSLECEKSERLRQTRELRNSPVSQLAKNKGRKPGFNTPPQGPV